MKTFENYDRPHACSKFSSQYMTDDTLYIRLRRELIYMAIVMGRYQDWFVNETSLVLYIYICRQYIHSQLKNPDQENEKSRYNSIWAIRLTNIITPLNVVYISIILRHSIQMTTHILSYIVWATLIKIQPQDVQGLTINSSHHQN